MRKSQTLQLAEELLGNPSGHLAGSHERLRLGLLNPNDPEMRLFGQPDQVGEDSELTLVSLELTQHNVARVKGTADRDEIALTSRHAESGRIPNHSQAPACSRRQLGDQCVGDVLRIAVEIRVAGFVVERDHC
jgi:hypothetical protein